MTLKLKKKNATNHRDVVALPHPDDKDDSLYEKIAMMNTVKTISNLEDVTPLPIRPILVDRDLKDILEGSNKERP